jgi:hypothetical protein
METAKTVEEVAGFVDYAHPAIMAEKALRAMHDAALERNWYEARDQALMTIKWAAEAHAALLVMQEKDK